MYVIVIIHNVTIERLGPGPLAKDWIARVLMEKSNFDALPDQNRHKSHIDDIVRMLQTNTFLFLRPIVEGVPAGLYWGQPIDCGLGTVHQFCMPEFRKGLLAVRIAKSCTMAAFLFLPSVHRLIGFTPIHDDYRAALVVGLRAGYKQVGVMPRFFRHHGEDLDCAIIVKERPNATAKMES